MSLADLKERKLMALQNSLQREPGFMFSEKLSEAFKLDGKPYQVQSILSEREKRADHLEPIITFSESIQPILMSKNEDLDMPQAPDLSQANDTENLENMTELLDSVHIFSLSSSQIPVEKKSIVLSDLIKLPLANLKSLMLSVDFNSWSIDVITDLYKEIIDNEVPSRNASLLVQATAIPKIIQLKSSAPRLLMNSILLLAKKDAKAVLDGLLLPLLFYSDLGRPKTEIIIKVISESLNVSQRLQLLQTILSDGELYFSIDDNVIPSLDKKYLRPWSENTMQIIHSTLSTQPYITLNKSCLSHLLQATQITVQLNPKDKNSMQLLLILTSKYPLALIEFQMLGDIEDICKSSTMFLKRSVLGQIASIKKNKQM